MQGTGSQHREWGHNLREDGFAGDQRTLAIVANPYPAPDPSVSLKVRHRTMPRVRIGAPKHSDAVLIRLPPPSSGCMIRTDPNSARSRAARVDGHARRHANPRRTA